MTQVNIPETKTDLSRLMKMLEAKQEDVIYMEKNEIPVAQMILIPPQYAEKRIGVAESKFKIPDKFDEWDKEIEEMFEEQI